MRHGYCLIDTNNIGFAAQVATKLTVGGRETQAIFGVIRTVRQIVASHGHSLDPMCLWDGRSWRHGIFTEYKANRDANPKLVAISKGYKAQRADMSKGLKLLGVPQVIAGNMEADDLAGMIVAKAVTAGKKVVLISGDRDWLQLVGPRVSWHDPIRDVFVREGNFADVTGYASPEAFLQGKALQGDQGDNIPGVGGIGEKGAKELISKFGSVEAFIKWYGGPEATILGKRLDNFARNAEGGLDKFARNVALMSLLPSNGAPPPERLLLTKAPLDEDRFKDFCAEFAFHSILKDFEEWIAPFRNLREVRAAA